MKAKKALVGRRRKLADRHKNYFHQATANLVGKYRPIVTEDLPIKKLLHPRGWSRSPA